MGLKIGTRLWRREGGGVGEMWGVRKLQASAAQLFVERVVRISCGQIVLENKILLRLLTAL